MGDAGQQARRVVEELRTALQATAVQSVKTTRSLAKFDEINRLPAPAAQKAAAPEKERRTAGNAGGTARRTAKGSDGRDWADGWRAVLDSLRGVWADFWAYLSGFFAPFAAAWQTVWNALREAVLRVWQPLWAELETVLAPAAALLDTVWQGLWAGLQNAWALYGQPILAGLAEGWQNVAGLVSALWSGVVQPVLLQLFALLDTLWAAHLQPLWNELTACLGAVGTLLLTVWNTVLAPFMQWLLTALAPAAVEVFTVLGTAVTGAAGIAADGITMLLLSLIHI